MKKSKLQASVTACKTETAEAITTIINSISAQGQRKKLLKDEKVKALLERYNITIE